MRTAKFDRHVFGGNHGVSCPASAVREALCISILFSSGRRPQQWRGKSPQATRPDLSLLHHTRGCWTRGSDSHLESPVTSLGLEAVEDDPAIPIDLDPHAA